MYAEIASEPWLPVRCFVLDRDDAVGDVEGHGGSVCHARIGKEIWLAAARSKHPSERPGGDDLCPL